MSAGRRLQGVPVVFVFHNIGASVNRLTPTRKFPISVKAAIYFLFSEIDTNLDRASKCSHSEIEVYIEHFWNLGTQEEYRSWRPRVHRFLHEPLSRSTPQHPRSRNGISTEPL